MWPYPGGSPKASEGKDGDIPPGLALDSKEENKPTDHAMVVKEEGINKRRHSDPTASTNTAQQFGQFRDTQKLIHTELHQFASESLSPVLLKVQEQLGKLQVQQNNAVLVANQAMSDLANVASSFREEHLGVISRLQSEEQALAFQRQQIIELHGAQQMNEPTMSSVARSIDEMAQGASQRMTETATILQNQQRVIDGVRFHSQDAPNQPEAVIQHDPRLDCPSEGDPFAKAYGDRRRPRIPAGEHYRSSHNPAIPPDVREMPANVNPPNASTDCPLGVTMETPWAQLLQPQSMLAMPKLVTPPTFDPPRYYSWKKI